MSLITLPSIKVMYTTAEEATGGIPGAWNCLESSLPSLKGRKFYGTFLFPEGPYRACVAVTDEDAGQLQSLERWTIPGRGICPTQAYELGAGSRQDQGWLLGPSR